MSILCGSSFILSVHRVRDPFWRCGQMVMKLHIDSIFVSRRRRRMLFALWWDLFYAFSFVNCHSLECLRVYALFRILCVWIPKSSSHTTTCIDVIGGRYMIVMPEQYTFWSVYSSRNYLSLSHEQRSWDSTWKREREKKKHQMTWNKNRALVQWHEKNPKTY